MGIRFKRKKSSRNVSRKKLSLKPMYSREILLNGRKTRIDFVRKPGGSIEAWDVSIPGAPVKVGLISRNGSSFKVAKPYRKTGVGKTLWNLMNLKQIKVKVKDRLVFALSQGMVLTNPGELKRFGIEVEKIASRKQLIKEIMEKVPDTAVFADLILVREEKKGS